MVAALWILGASIVRNVCGWAENSLKDGKISTYEWGQLGSTIFRVGIIGFGLHLGFDLSGLEAGGGAVVADFIIAALKGRKK